MASTGSMEPTDSLELRWQCFGTAVAVAGEPDTEAAVEVLDTGAAVAEGLRIAG